MTDTTTRTDLKHRYLTSQLIPYIGNKRRLLPFLHGVFDKLASSGGIPVFIDPFAGSGAVSRLAKLMGMAVRTNDWEPYTEIVNGCHIALDERDIDSLFIGRGGIDAVLSALNTDDGSFTPYISRHYAPRNLAQADYRTERLFYTPRNAVFLDRVRGRIEEWYPESCPEKTVLLSALILQAATCVNTSGVFKACHKGFGGHGADALGRILRDMRLQRPVLIDGAAPCTVERRDAAAFAAAHPADICYLDPPYNIHQYGSNYHLLNTLSVWDRPAVNDRLGADGRLEEKAGIRRDWTARRSSFCSRATAPGALRDLLDAVDARYVVLSYNTEGIISFEELYDILSSRGEVEIRTQDYVVYRGGRQSIHRKTANLELQLIVQTRRPGRRDGGEAVRDFLLRRRFYLLLKESFVPRRLRSVLPCEDDGSVALRITGNSRILLPTLHCYRFSEIPPFRCIEEVPADDLARIYKALQEAVCRDRKEEVTVLFELLEGELSAGQRRYFQDTLILVLKKFAHKKYRGEFEAAVAELRKRIDEKPDSFERLSEGLTHLETLAALRFQG